MSTDHSRAARPASGAEAGPSDVDLERERAGATQDSAAAEPTAGPGAAPEGPPEPSGAGPAPGVAEPAAAAATLQEALDAEHDKYLRLAAEFENFRRRSLRERQEAGWRAQADLVQGLVDVLDDIMRFAHVDPSTADAETVVHGVALVEKKIFKTLGGHGLELVNPVDHPFDPALHEAVGTEPAASEAEDHLVARVYQPGYVFRGQLLRPARVVVRQWLS